MDKKSDLTSKGGAGYQQVADIELAESAHLDGSFSTTVRESLTTAEQDSCQKARTSSSLQKMRRLYRVLWQSIAVKQFWSTVKLECYTKPLNNFREHATKKDYIRLAATLVLLVLQFSTKFVFQRTVDTPSELDWLIGHIAMLTGLVAFTAITNLVCIFGVWWLQHSLCLLLAQVLFMLYFTTRKLGWSLQNHGGFNTGMFYLLFVPVLVLVLTGILIYKLYRKNRCTRVLACVIVFLIVRWLVHLCLRLKVAKDVWPLGLQGERLIESHEYCHVVMPGFMYIDMLDGYMNKWVELLPGDVDCLSRSADFQVRFDEPETQILVKCPAGTVKVEILPLIEKWTSAERGDKVSQDYAKNIINRTVSETVAVAGGQARYSVGALENESFRVWCNGESRLLTRITRRAVRAMGDVQAQAPSIPPVNVLTVFIDALSRRHFMRKFPETIKLLNDRQRLSGMGTELFQFFRYHSITFHTYLNALALYTGQTKELNVNSYNLNYDTLPMIHEYYQKFGWVTARIEGQCQNVPEEFFSRQTSWDHEFNTPVCDARYHDIDPEKTFNNFHGPYGCRDRCIDGELVHRVIFNYHKLFSAKFKSLYGEKNWFSYITLMEGHEGTGEVIKGVDKDLADMLEHDVDLDNTVVIINSDHGLHMGLWWALQTDDIITENRLPFLAILMPQRLLQTRPDWRDNLKYNAQTLITHFDLRQFMLQLLEDSAGLGRLEPTGVQAQLSSNEEFDSETQTYKRARLWIKGESILQQLEKSRNCTQIGVPEHFCRCK